ncbi:MAG: InlB B-repeat-containing protein, partial [Muribaculaceae bacterium]|nr:InlB B-repeat-containing protein [Muribaculaceae bacterium]
ATPMKDCRLTRQARNKDGGIASSREFQINAESLEGFRGEVDLASDWSLGGGETGIANILFIPTKYAAPTSPTEYSFGGSFSFTDPFTGMTVTRQLNPVILTVNPTPELNMTYFMQRDVLGDDPLTEIVEPSEEAEFSLLIHNIGNGDATDIRMMTEQPRIVDNEKGLYVNFEMISSQLNGGDKDLALGSSAPTAFGDIIANETAYAQWWFKSSLLGHFYEYDVNATHVSSYDNPDLSLLNEVTIHELIRSVDAERDGVMLKGFMTNDIPDVNDAPDMIYLSDGSIEEVHPIAALSLNKLSEDNYVLSVTPGARGWNYGYVTDPTYGVSKIKSIVRKSDGRQISLRNIWQTDRTMRDGKDPLYENLIHFADDMSASGSEEYEIIFSPAPELLLEVASIEGTPIDGSPAKKPINTLNVMFNKFIDPTSFSPEDIEMSAQGNRIESDGIVITSDDNKTFHMDLSAVDQSTLGFYTLTVNTQEITDAEGFNGRDGKTVVWSYFPDGNVSIAVSTYPENAGSVMQLIDGSDTPVSLSSGIKAKYGESITLTAVPEEGYDFEEWINNDRSYSSNAVIEFKAISNDELIAEFSPKTYSVEIDPFCKGGSILGTSSGIYSYGDELSLLAVPQEGYVFRHWLVNGEELKENSAYILTVKGTTSVSAVFTEGSGVETISGNPRIMIYSLDGLLIDEDATLDTIQNLDKGVYIINGVKFIVR